MEFESGDWVRFMNEDGQLVEAQVINYLEDEDKYIVSGYPHRLCRPNELMKEWDE